MSTFPTTAKKSQLRHGLPVVSASQLRSRLSEWITTAQQTPVTVASRGVRPRAVLVSMDFFDRAMEALEDREDNTVADAALARNEFVGLDEFNAALDADD